MFKLVVDGLGSARGRVEHGELELEPIPQLLYWRLFYLRIRAHRSRLDMVAEAEVLCDGGLTGSTHHRGASASS